MAEMGRGGAEDRLSSLPDELLHLIIGMLPLKHAIRTSALSTRWTRLWHHALAAAPALDFGGDFACGQSPAQLVATLSRYLDIHGGAAIDRFRVVFCPFDAFAGDIQEWVRKVVAKGVKELEVDLSQGVLDADLGVFVDGRKPLELPSHLFQCGDGLLARLSLSRCHLAGSLEATGFSGLRSLSVNDAGVTEDMLQDVLSNCPVLEFLSLMNCRLLKWAKVTSARLLGLELVGCRDMLELEVWAPMLRSFILYGTISYLNNFGHVPAVQDAYVCLLVDDFDSYEVGYEDILLAVAHNATIMTLCSECMACMELIKYYEVDFVFETPNLQELQLLMGAMSDEDLQCIITFFGLCKSPFLERLFIRLPSEVEDPADTSSTAATSLDIPPDVAFSHLRFVKVVNFRGTRCELRLLRFLLEKATVLESMVVVTLEEEDCNNVGGGENENGSLHLKILRGQVSMMRKASPEARVVVCRQRDDGSRNPGHMRFYHEEKYSSVAVTSVNTAPQDGMQH